MPSATVSAKTEIVSSVFAVPPPTTEVLLTNPGVGFTPTILLNAAGTRPEPAASFPRANDTRPAPTATPEPELEPPGMKSGLNGLRATP
jgi:hypothetical protein